MVARVERIEVIVTQSEGEALHLEQNLIKRHRPPFNVRLRDDKSYPYIAVTVGDDYPRVMFTRERHRRGVVYFGPYSSAKKVRETLDVLNRVFRYRPCEGPQPGRHSGHPVPRLPHRALPRAVRRLRVEGGVPRDHRRRRSSSSPARPSRSSSELETPMQEAAERQEFEEAARYRNRLFAVRHLAERQAADRRDIGTVDVIGIAVARRRRRRPGVSAPRRAPRRPARLHARERRRPGHADARRGVLPRVLRGSAPSVPPLIVVPPECRRPRRARGVPLRASRLAGRGARRPARREATPPGARAAQRRAGARAARSWRPSGKRLRRIEALEELREALNLESLPIRIECFDISNIQDESPVGSMVVFEDAVAEEGPLPEVRRPPRRAARTTSR